MGDYSKDTLINEHMGLAKAIAIQQWQTAPYALELEEMISLANLGLVDAADRWEPYCAKNGFDPGAVEFFKVYAQRRIYGTVRDAIRASDWATRTLRDKARRLKQAGQDEGATAGELAKRTGLTIKEVNKTIQRMAAQPISLEQTHEDQERPQQPADPIDVEGRAFENDMLSVATKTIRELPSDQQVVLALHYYKALEIRTVARVLNITESRASQLHTKAVLTVREALMKAAAEGEYV